MDQQWDKIIVASGELGRQIAGTAVGKAFLQTRQKVQEDEQALKMLEDYQKQLQKIAELERKGQPIEPEDKRELTSLQQKIASHENLKAWMRTQADFTELMRKVNRGIAEPFEDQSAGQAGPASEE